MKLIPLIILVISLAVDSEPHEHFTFPPQFQSPHPGIFTSQKSPYLPPESHTPIPYFAINNINKLPFPYLPPSATKAPMGYPSPFPIKFSTTVRPMNNANDDDDDDEDDKPTSPIPHFLRTQANRTERIQQQNQRLERREMRPIPKSFQHAIDRIDTKLPFHGSLEASTQHTITMAPRSIVISDFNRDFNNMDQMKAASIQNAQYLPQPGVFISSTTEPAIPILRLSNEMDLDGSFSYEALGADQTHYVQHSRMENAGTGKDEQVVEGSYSYVGDNGRTYTVHYIADSNGFRASGDHLPVAPPIPEIIQRAIQYNLAEEAKKPPHLQSWNEDNKENELSESEKRNRFAIAPPRLSNLFTGKTPESFSHSFSNTQNNLVAAASSQAPQQTTNIDFSDQMHNKPNTGTISPQITFLASQGAHVPSVNAPQQTINRMFTTEKSTMPQLVNYEANMKESDQDKALWRWQYGINGNINQNAEKNSISRSFGADDIIINFNDMTPEQYTNMIKQQLEPSGRENIEAPKPNLNYPENNAYSNANNNTITNNYQLNNGFPKVENPTTNDYQYSTSSTDWYQKQQADYNNPYVPNTMNIPKQEQNEGSQTSRPKIITQQQFIPRSQTVTQTYNYDENNFESRRTKTLNTDISDSHENTNLNVIPLNYAKNQQYTTGTENSYTINNNDQIVTTLAPSSTITNILKYSEFPTTMGNIKFTDFIVTEKDNKDEFKPLYNTFTEVQPEATTTSTTTEPSIENIFEENLFLKNLFNSNKKRQDDGNNIREDNKDLQVKPIIEKIEKQPKYIQYQSKPQNEIKATKKKPIDIADILNYISRNQFESNKVNSRPKQSQNHMKQNNEMQYYNEDDEDFEEDFSTRNHRTLHQGELRGVIKNYKVLQRNNNMANTQQNEGDRLRRNLSPPPLRPHNLPPLGRAGPSMKPYLPPVYV